MNENLKRAIELIEAEYPKYRIHRYYTNPSARKIYFEIYNRAWILAIEYNLRTKSIKEISENLNRGI